MGAVWERNKKDPNRHELSATKHMIASERFGTCHQLTTPNSKRTGERKSVSRLAGELRRSTNGPSHFCIGRARPALSVTRTWTTAGAEALLAHCSLRVGWLAALPLTKVRSNGSPRAAVLRHAKAFPSSKPLADTCTGATSCSRSC